MDILQEADRIVNGPRRQAYGPAKESFGKVAKLWSVVINKKITPQQVVTMMILLKLARELNAHKEDNIVDIAGYAQVLQAIYDD